MGEQQNINSAGMESKVAKNNFIRALSAFIGGFLPKRKDKKGSIGAEKNPVDFVKIDVENSSPLKAALDPSRLFTAKDNSTLEKLFDSWIQDISEISFQDRLTLYAEIDFMAQSDPFVSRVINLVADEATQLDVQDHIISVETPDPRMTRRIYELLKQWGVSQSRTRSTIFNIYKYGDAFWGIKVSERGVEKILPLSVRQVIQRLEFNPVEIVEKLSEIKGYGSLLSKSQYLQKLFDIINGEETSSDVANIFETHLFGFILHDDIVVPPWEILHFRYNYEGTEMFPYGRSDLIDVLTPFKLSQSTQTLQSIARTQSFPVTVYAVETPNTMDEVSKFEAVEKIRQEYENVGVTPSTGQSEVYSVNTKMWMPKDLVDVTIHKSEVDIDFVGDLEMYQDRVVVATGVPKGYLVQEWGGFGNSAISLTEQFKPFARKVFSIQSVFLETLEHLIRLHFAITQEFDYKSTFTLSMRFPAEEVSDEKNTARSNSLDLASSIIDTVKLALGADEEEQLPPAVIKDILSKYTFISPEDIAKWTNASNIFWTSGAGGAKSEEDDEGGMGGREDDFGGEDDFDFGEDDDIGGSDESGSEEPSSGGIEDDFDFGEAVRVSAAARRARRLLERKKELISRYKESKDQIYIDFLEKNMITEFVRNRRHVRTCLNSNFYSYIYEVFDPKKKVAKQSALREKIMTGVSKEVQDGPSLTEILDQTRKEMKGQSLEYDL